MKPFTQIEEELVAFWKENKIFEKSVEARDAENAYVFYDGPPFATGLPHYGHIVTSTMKDIIPRYWTMKGRRVERKWGWDCHGLPIENIIEQELKIDSKKGIEELGVAKFNEACESKVLLYAEEWKKTIARLGRWVDMDSDYKTMDLNFMESVWWVFKSLWDKGMIYDGKKSMHICPRCETTLSNMEVAEGYRDIVDLSVTAKFELVDSSGMLRVDNDALRPGYAERLRQGEEPQGDIYILAWTTTPWTLPGNVALAVGADVEYSLWRVENLNTHEVENYIVAKDLSLKVFDLLFDGEDIVVGRPIENENKRYELVRVLKGKELEGKKYKPLFDYFIDADMPNKENLYTIVTADFVSTEEGTGVVHIAPAFGEDDMLLGQEKNLPFIQHVLPNGRFVDEVRDWAGLEVKPKENPMATDKLVVEYLQKHGLVFASQEYTHSYPHCWRCDTPLLNYATSSWFVAVTKVKEDLLEQAKKIYWFPEHIKDGRFGKWLEGAKDWAISRSRYWGNPMPVWRCACGETIVVGSQEELAKLSGAKVENLHKQFVDAIEIPCPKCGAKARRIPEVLDCWFESASMPYGQQHYPFENKEKFEKNFPAEFIAEGVDQTRAWFYVLHVLSVSLFNQPAYKNVIVNGTVLAEDGQKMSKRKKNYPDPTEVIEKYGSDALRYYLMSSPVVRAEDLCFSEKGVEDVYRRVILTLLNVLSFYQMYHHTNQVDAVAGAGTVGNIPVSKNVLDRWIIAKMNLLIAEVTEKLDAYNLADALKPIGEFVNELSTWFVRRSRDRFKKGDDKEKTQAIETLGWILRELSVLMAPFTPFIAEHVYKSLNIENAAESVHLVDWARFESLSVTSKELLVEMDFVRQVVELGLAIRDEKGIKVRQPLPFIKYGGKKLSGELETIVAEELNVKEVIFEKDLAKDIATDPMNSKTFGDCVVKLNVEIDARLEQEGLLRELVRQINSLRKKQGLTISDRVVISYKTDSDKVEAVFADAELVEQLKSAVLASDIKVGEGDVELKANGEVLFVGLRTV